MSNRFRWAAMLLTLALVAAVGVFTYDLGVAHGVAQVAPTVVAPGAPGSPGNVVPYVFYPRPYGWGFGIFPFFGLFWLALIFLFARRLWWGPRWYGRGYGWRGCYGRTAPEFDERRRRAHDGEPTTL